MIENLAGQGLACCGLPGAWADRPAWTVLDTDFRDGQGFLAAWRAWRRDTHRPGLLHYVGIAHEAPNLEAPTGLALPHDRAHHWRDLAHACKGLGPGFHRMLFDDARVSLTLCLGDVAAVLREHVFLADSVFSRAPTDKWEVQLLARRSRRGTRLSVRTAAPAATGMSAGERLFALLQTAGFHLEPCHCGEHTITGTFNPRWEIPSGRSSASHVVQNPSHCAIIGAGLAGASVAQALALRGWQVTVFDQEAAPAGGASGLPAGLAVPHVSADDSPRSRLTRGGTRLLMQHADRLLRKGEDWARTGVIERRPGATALWHAQACWIKPATLVRAWLAQPGVRFVGQTKIAKLRRVDGNWWLDDPQGQELGGFAIVILANALACAALLKDLPAEVRPKPDVQDKLAALQAVHGTLSHGVYAEAIPGLPATPVNGNGCFIPHLPGAGGEQWLAGATFETDALAAADLWAQHAANMNRLRLLLPMGELDLPDTLDRGPVSLWTATRCVTHDRLPLVGPVDAAVGSGLWLCVGLGSRGLSLSALCAELLAARLGGEPLPVEFSLSRSLDVNRARRKRGLDTEA